MDRPTNRWPIAIGLGAVVGLIQLFLFVAIAYFAWCDLLPGASSPILAPVPCFSQVVNHQLVFPVGAFAFQGSGQNGIATCNRIRAVDLVTGKTRDFPTPGLPFTAIHILPDGQNMWFVFGDQVTRFNSSYQFGHDTVVLASPLRRSIARTIDLSLSIVPLICAAFWIFAQHFDWSLFELISNGSMATFQPLVHFVAWVVAYWCCSTITTGVWGVTPGKWICQIRVVRSTLRRCGFARALLRELLLWIDMPQLLTAIPGVVSMVATRHRQRIGDLIAGTVVVSRRS